MQRVVLALSEDVDLLDDHARADVARALEFRDDEEAAIAEGQSSLQGATGCAKLD